MIPGPTTALTIRRSDKRRTVSLQVRPGEVVLHAPRHVPEAELLRFYERKRAWVERHLQAFAGRERQRRSFEAGDTLPLLGETLTIQLSGATQATRQGEILFLPDVNTETRRTATKAFYKREALNFFTAESNRLAASLGERVKSVRLSEARTRWGSCSANGSLRYSWRVLLGPCEVVLYLAAHEVAHLREMNHGPRFWAVVKQLYPEYTRWQAVLKRDGHLYTLD